MPFKLVAVASFRIKVRVAIDLFVWKIISVPGGGLKKITPQKL